MWKCPRPYEKHVIKNDSKSKQKSFRVSPKENTVFLERSEGTVRSYPDQSGTLVKLQIITSRYALLMMAMGDVSSSEVTMGEKLSCSIHCLPGAKRRNCQEPPCPWQNMSSKMTAKVNTVIQRRVENPTSGSVRKFSRPW
jgi:hypothetical protein